MNAGLTEEEMRQALFGPAVVPVQIPELRAQEELPVIVMIPPSVTAKRTTPKRNTPKITVTLRVGNEFEAETWIFIHEADTLSTLQAELDAKKAVRKKFKYIEVVSVKAAS